MELFWLIFILMAGGLLAWVAGRFSDVLPRIVSLLTLAVGVIMTISLWTGINDNQHWIREIKLDWIPRFGIHFQLAMDGMSLLLVLLTMFLGLISVVVSWKEIQTRTGFFHFNLLWVLTGITGVFLAMDLFLFYFFWEVMLIPMYFLIGIWGHENRKYAAYKFFIFTQAGGLLMFLSILVLYFITGHVDGNYTFDYFAIVAMFEESAATKWIMIGFLAAFLVKLPAIPLHNWLPDAHTQAPTAGSIVLAGLLLKTGAYGLFRFIIPLFPEASQAFAPIAIVVGITGILYGAKLAFAQTDLKRMVAYTSISHMGFVLLGVFVFQPMALKGAFIQIITHGISTGALFMIAGALQDRLHTRDIREMGGFWNAAPRMGGITLIFVLASLGLPGLGNFVAEFLILAGAFQVNVVASIIATLGLIASAIYGLYLMQKVFFGTKPDKHLQLKDFNVREMVAGLSLVIIIVWIGLFPGIFLKIMDGQTEYKQHPEEFMQTKSDVKYQSTRENSSEIIPVTRKKQKPE
jgi:NADH-quinone oxidoreductase subunit M